MIPDEPLYAPPTDAEVNALLNNPRFLRDMGLIDDTPHDCSRCADFPDLVIDLEVSRAELVACRKRIVILKWALGLVISALAGYIAAKV